MDRFDVDPDEYAEELFTITISFTSPNGVDREITFNDLAARQPEDAETIALSAVPDDATDIEIETTKKDFYEVEFEVEQQDYDVFVTCKSPQTKIPEEFTLKLWYNPDDNSVLFRNKQMKQWNDPNLWVAITDALNQCGYSIDTTTVWDQDDSEIEDGQILDEDDE